MKVLELRDIHTYYGASHILQGISLFVEKGEVVCLLGRNGMGKTTTIKSIVGLTPPQRGTILLNDTDITRKRVHEIANLGIGYVPQGRGIFPDLTVKEHLETFMKSKDKSRKGAILDRIYIFFPVLKNLENRKGGNLSGGEQQMLAIARALAREPSLLLLDEPSEGLAPVILDMIAQLVKELKATGETILLAEQNVRFALDLSDRIYILEKGQIRLEKEAKGLTQDDEDLKRYLAV